MASQTTSLRVLESQVGQLASSLSSRQQGALPSDTEVPKPKGKAHCYEHYKATTTKSDIHIGKPIEEPKKNDDDGPDSKIKQEIQYNVVILETKPTTMFPVMPPPMSRHLNPRPPTLFPQRFKNANEDQRFRKFIKVLRQLTINIPFIDSLERNMNYIKFIKEVLLKKQRVSEFKTVALTEGCSAIAASRLPPKLKTFGIGKAHHTTMTLQLVDRSIVHPDNTIDNVLIQVENFIFHTNFIILDCEDDKYVSIILVKPFLVLGRVIIDVEKGELTTRLNKEHITLNILNLVMNDDNVECHSINIIDEIVHERMDESYNIEIVIRYVTVTKELD
ncbi:uncharacterized protein LOC120115624 [Hibiscus syriacus]|uniref:uncharacterized protein LOC120115624 n=1 Tax=Hibiscus syriacus TaxID=106335 RepID=UPI00192315A3|nr:uncharacterized protein LOC120115624 [Hibiscus syriacus]